MVWQGTSWQGVAWPGTAGQGFCGLRPVGGRVRLRTDRRRSKARLGRAWRGVAGRGKGCTGSGPLRAYGAWNGPETVQGKARQVMAWQGRARQGGQGKGCNQALALGGRLHQRSDPEARRGNRGPGRSPGASQPSYGRYFSKENSKKRTVD
jgi:hypothetical protein